MGRNELLPTSTRLNAAEARGRHRCTPDLLVDVPRSATKRETRVYYTVVPDASCSMEIYVQQTTKINRHAFTDYKVGDVGIPQPPQVQQAISSNLLRPDFNILHIFYVKDFYVDKE